VINLTVLQLYYGNLKLGYAKYLCILNKLYFRSSFLDYADLWVKLQALLTHKAQIFKKITTIAKHVEVIIKDLKKVRQILTIHILQNNNFEFNWICSVAYPDYKTKRVRIELFAMELNMYENVLSYSVHIPCDMVASLVIQHYCVLRHSYNKVSLSVNKALSLIHPTLPTSIFNINSTPLCSATYLPSQGLHLHEHIPKLHYRMDHIQNWQATWQQHLH